MVRTHGERRKAGGGVIFPMEIEEFLKTRTSYTWMSLHWQERFRCRSSSLDVATQ